MVSVSTLFQPTIDAFLSPSIPFAYRWRLLVFQPVALLTLALNGIPCLLSRRTTSLWIPTRSGLKHCLVWRPTSASTRLSPLHLDIHGGGFIGGHPSASYRFCSTLADRTGTIVVGASHRFAPRHPFPAAIDDIDDIVSWLHSHAEAVLHADPTIFTIGGSSAGGALALSAAQAAGCHGDSPTAFKASVTFYAPIDLRLAPWEKPVPENFPKKDPMRWLLPLIDCYAMAVRAVCMDDPRLSPVIADVKVLPEKMMLVVAGIDILVHESLTFVERVRREIEGVGKDEGSGDGGRERKGREVRVKFMEKCFHGWLELPDAVLNRNEGWKGTREVVFNDCVEFIRGVHRENGWNWQND